MSQRVLLVASTSLLKNGVLVALLWWSWERAGAAGSGPSAARTVSGALVAVAAARALQDFLPARLRPLYDPAIAAAGFVPPMGLPPGILHAWSSFPSDHAVLAFALATAVFLAHRSVGMFAYAWAALVICLPRMYLGIHYPSDIVGGALIGIAIMVAAARLPVPVRAKLATAWLVRAFRG